MVHGIPSPKRVLKNGDIVGLDFGVIYVGYYGHGFVNIVVIASIITILVRETAHGLIPFFVIFMIFFWLYNIVDASRRATLYNQSLEGLGPGALPDIGIPRNRGSLFWGAALILVGVFFLSNTAFGLSLEWLERWWPVALVITGVYLVYKSIVERNQQ